MIRSSLLLGLTLPYSWDNLSSGNIRTNCCNKTNHCCTCVKDFCFRCKTKFHCLFSSVVLIMMMRSPSWVNCNSSSGCHSSSSYKSSSFWISSYRAFGLGISGSSVYFVYSAVSISFMIFVTNHAPLRVLKCGHEHNKEKYSWCADKNDGNNNIISQEFDQIRHQ